MTLSVKDLENIGVMIRIARNEIDYDIAMNEEHTGTKFPSTTFTR